LRGWGKRGRGGQVFDRNRIFIGVERGQKAALKVPLTDLLPWGGGQGVQKKVKIL